ncbi:MAG: hydrogenase maturation nickel metallochaperone HypA [Mariniphaga sp.]
MHELSLAYEVIELAKREVVKNKVTTIFEMEIEVGDLSGVEADAFQSALEMIAKSTLLEHTLFHINRQPATGRCSTCDLEFEMKERMATCPTCHRFPSQISGGENFRVTSILAE